MNPNDITDDVTIPGADIVDDSPAVAEKTRLSPIVKVMALAGSAVIVLGAALLLTNSNMASAPSATPRVGAIDSTPGGQVQQNNPAYQESLRELNERRAENAADRGATSMPTPEVVLLPAETVTSVAEVPAAPPAAATPAAEPAPKPKVVERRALPRPPSAPATARTAPEQAPAAAAPRSSGNAAQEEPENPYLTRMAGMMDATARSFAPKEMSVSTSKAKLEDDAEQAARAQAAQNGANTTAQDGTGQVYPTQDAGPDYSAGNMILRPGDVLYAETLTSVNSDMSSPVMAEVVSGDLKGARVVGQFTADKASARMIVEFDTMTFPDGRVYDISAVAVDGKSAETAVASDVERRYVARYGPLLAATFISSYARAVAQPAQTVIGSGDDAQVITEQSDEKEALLAGVSAASSVIAQDIASYAPKGPKIILKDAWPIAILITERVLLDTPVREDRDEVRTPPVPRPGMPSSLPPGTIPVPQLNN